MLRLLVLSLLFTGGALSEPDHYSFSKAVGNGAGTSFSTEAKGRITGIRVWENGGNYIYGIQLRYDYIWTEKVGRDVGSAQEMTLHEGERVIQVSGKYNNNYIYYLVFVTSRGRSLMVGQPTASSFNMYPEHPDAELRLLSGDFNGNGITSLGAHWAVYSNHTDAGGEKTESRSY